MTSLSIILNITSSISIVMLNKWIYTHYGFPNITLTFIHFLVTFLGLKICEMMNIFNHKSIQLKDCLPLAMSFCGFVVLTNLSLQHNTVGTYQLIKVLTTPCIMMIHTYMYNKKYSYQYHLSLVGRVCFNVKLRVVFQISRSFIQNIYTELIIDLEQTWGESFTSCLYQSADGMGILIEYVIFLLYNSDSNNIWSVLEHILWCCIQFIGNIVCWSGCCCYFFLPSGKLQEPVVQSNYASQIKLNSNFN